MTTTEHYPKKKKT